MSKSKLLSFIACRLQLSSNQIKTPNCLTMSFFLKENTSIEISQEKDTCESASFLGIDLHFLIF